MFTITSDQMAAFSKYMYTNFQVKAWQHLVGVFPKTCLELGDVGVAALVNKGIERAAKYNIVGRNDVLGYLELMVSLGEDFDTDPKTAWVQNTLKIRNLNGADKIKRLLNIHPPQQEFI